MKRYLIGVIGGMIVASSTLLGGVGGCGGSDGSGTSNSQSSSPSSNPQTSQSPTASLYTICSCDRSDLDVCEDFLISSAHSINTLNSLTGQCNFESPVFAFLSGCPADVQDGSGRIARTTCSTSNTHAICTETSNGIVHRLIFYVNDPQAQAICDSMNGILSN